MTRLDPNDDQLTKSPGRALKAEAGQYRMPADYASSLASSLPDRTASGFRNSATLRAVAATIVVAVAAVALVLAVMPRLSGPAPGSFGAPASVTSAPGLTQPLTPSPIAVPEPKPVPSVMVIVGVDANNASITEPLYEVAPERHEGDSRLELRFRDLILLGIEGGEVFLRATTPDGGVMFDARVDYRNGETVALPAGDYRLTTYYRSCDGSCSLLDPPVELCSLEAQLVEGGGYTIVTSLETETCALQQGDEAVTLPRPVWEHVRADDAGDVSITLRPAPFSPPSLATD